MVYNHPDNPNTSFDGIAREPTNAELALGWKRFLSFAALGLVWLWIEWALLLQPWALEILRQALAAWALLAFVTWRRPILYCAASVALAFVVASKAFAQAFYAELRAA